MSVILERDYNKGPSGLSVRISPKKIVLSPYWCDRSFQWIPDAEDIKRLLDGVDQFQNLTGSVDIKQQNIAGNQEFILVLSRLENKVVLIFERRGSRRPMPVYLLAIEFEEIMTAIRLTVEK